MNDYKNGTACAIVTGVNTAASLEVLESIEKRLTAQLDKLTEQNLFVTKATSDFTPSFRR